MIVDDHLNMRVRQYIFLVVDTQFCIHNLILKDDWNNHSKYPKIIIAFHVLNHSSHIIKWSWDSKNHDNTFDFQIGPSDWKILQDQVFIVCMHLLGEADHVWLYVWLIIFNDFIINFKWILLRIQIQNTSKYDS